MLKVCNVLLIVQLNDTMLRLIHPKEEDTFPHQIVCLQLVLFDPSNPRSLSVSVDPVPSASVEHDQAAGSGTGSASCSWWCDEVRKEDRCISWPIRDGDIRCFVKLYPGQNEITFRCRGEVLLSHRVWFTPSSCPSGPGIQFVYVRCCDGEGRYQYYHPGSPPKPLSVSGEDLQGLCHGGDRIDSQETGLQKVKLHALLAQCFYAEELVSRGYDRKTFNLTEPEDTMLRLIHPKEEDTFPHQIVCLQLVLFDPSNPRSLSVSVDPVPSASVEHDQAAGSGTGSASCSWWCDEVRKEDRCISWPIRDGDIRCFVKLYPGQNEITFRCRGEVLLSHRVWFTPSSCPSGPGIQFVYVRCCDGEGRYQYYHPGSPPKPLSVSGEDLQGLCHGGDRIDSQETGLQKVKLHALLAQCFYAEELVSRGYDRKTFNLTEPEVFTLSQTEAEVLGDDFLEKNNRIYNIVYQQLEKKGMIRGDRKVTAILGFCQSIGLILLPYSHLSQIENCGQSIGLTGIMARDFDHFDGWVLSGEGPGRFSASSTAWLNKHPCLNGTVPTHQELVVRIPREGGGPIELGGLGEERVLIDSGCQLSIHHDSHLIRGVEMSGKVLGEVSEHVTIMPPIETLAGLSVRTGALIDSLAWDEGPPSGKMVRIGGSGGSPTEIELSSDLVVYLVLNQGKLVGISLDSKNSIHRRTVCVVSRNNVILDVILVHDKERDCVDSYSENTPPVSQNIVFPSCQRFSIIAIDRSFDLYRWN
eukprot:sb/3462369/